MQKYFIGLDIGTDSVGWAVTDDNYNLLRARGRDMWGSYLFEEAEALEPYLRLAPPVQGRMLRAEAVQADHE